MENSLYLKNVEINRTIVTFEFLESVDYRYLLIKNDDLEFPGVIEKCDGKSKVVFNLYTIANGYTLPNGKWNVIARKVDNTESSVKVILPIKKNEKKIKIIDSKKDYFLVNIFTENENCILEVESKLKFKKAISKQKRLYIAAFNLFYRFKKYNRTPKVLFTSASRSEIGGNLDFVYKQLISDQAKVKIRMSFKKNIWERSNLKEKIALPFHAATADYIFIEDYQPMINELPIASKKDVKLVQLWHANGAFKTFGYSRLGKPAAPLLSGENHKIYDYSFVSSEYVAHHYAEAFAIPEKNVIATGIPKTDQFFSSEYIKGIQTKVFNEYPRLNDFEEIILFGPTFRGGGPKTAYFPFHKLKLQDIAEYCRENNAVFIIKAHFLVKNKFEIPEVYSDVILDFTEYREINDLLCVSDVLITDYSSTVYEASILNIPMVFYAFDQEEYISSRGFYEEYEEFVPGKIVNNFNQLIAVLKEKNYEHEKVEIFKNKNFDFSDGQSSSRILTETVYKTINKKES